MFLKTQKKTNYHCGKQMGFVKRMFHFNCFKQNQIQQINTTKLQAFHTINNTNSSGGPQLKAIHLRLWLRLTKGCRGHSVSVEYSLDNFHRSNQDT
jgi:hypothetical protein